jgi:4-amino-4-deoxy-L-arabinose transferase-like glycosyltransferase
MQSLVQRRFSLVCVGISVLVFAAIAPTLLWLEFSNSPEALNVATAQEIRRSGNWLVPTLQGQARLAKPPLPAWITAAGISETTLQRISSTSPAERQRGFTWLAWQTRWPALAAGCLMLLATAFLGRSVGGPQCGVLSLVTASTSVLFLRFTRYSATDVHLALWVSIANVMMIEATLKQRRWTGCIGAGVALGLALMSKGPVCLVQSVLPVLVWMTAMRLGRRMPGQPTALWPGVAPVLLGVGVMLAVALPWVILVLRREPDALSIWFTEITRQGATESKSGRWYSYVSLVPYTIPWILFFLIGLIVAANRRRATDWLILLLLVVPVLVMSLAEDRAQRYLLPMLPAAAVVCALGVEPLLHLNRRVGVWIVATLFVLMLVAQAGVIHVYRNMREGRAELKPLADTILDRFPQAQVFNAHPDGKRPPPEIGVYLHRELTWIADPSQLNAGAVPKVLLMLQRRNETEPQPPHGWELIEKRPRDREFWWAFVLPPRP